MFSVTHWLIEPFVERDMPSFATWALRAEFFAFIVTQCFILAAYLAEYEDNSFWYFTTVLFAPAVIAWICVILSKAPRLRSLFHVWSLYIFALVTNIAILFVLVGDKFDKEKFLGPNFLKVILSFTPLLLLLLLNTAGDSGELEKHSDVVATLSIYMAIDLFDGVEMIDIVLEEKQHHFGISKRFATAMAAVACFSILLSPWQIIENKLGKGEPKIRFRIAMLRNFVQMILNLVFLIIRVVVFFGYGKDESIFIVKNGVAIVLCLSQFRHLGRSRMPLRAKTLI